MRLHDASTLFGLPLVLEREAALSVAVDLRALLLRSLGRPLSSLERDVSDLGRYFDPARPGTAIRDALAHLADAPPLSSRLLQRSDLVIDPDGACLVGPEGRIALDFLDEALAAAGADQVVVFGASVPLEAMAQAGNQYREWAHRRIENALSLHAGTGETMRPLTVAWLLLLLINGSTSAERAIYPPPAGKSSPVAAAIDKILHLFADPLTASKRPSKPFSFESSWIVSEAWRRASAVLGPADNPREPRKHYIKPGAEGRAIDLVARELMRRRRPPSPSEITLAFDRLVDEYRRQIPVLVQAELTHENRANTRRIRVDLELAVERHSTSA